MKKIINIFRGIKNWFKAQIKCLAFKKIIKEQRNQIEELEEQLEKSKVEIERLQFEIDRDDKLRQIKYFEKRMEEFHVQRRMLRSEINEKNEIIKELEKKVK